MDEIALIRALPAGGEAPDAAVRAAALQALEARFDAATPVPARIASRVRRPLVLGRPRRLALAGAGAIVAVVAGALLVSSGPKAEPAVAEVLHRVATVAEASGPPAAAPPAPGQFLYTKTKVVQLQGWEPDGPGAGPRTRPRYFTANLLGPEGSALPALVPTLKEVWTARDGTTRERETLGRVEFLSDADQRRWQDAGSPPPFAYDPAEHEVQRDSSGRLVKDFESRSWRGSREFFYVHRLAKLPTEPEALRLVLENRPAPGQPRVQVIDPSPADSLRGRSTIERLMSILSEPITSPALRAAAFNALAEIPGIELEQDVTDVAGRRGDAIWFAERGFGRQFIFDPHTSKILAQAEMIFNAKAADYPEIPDDTVFREIAYLQSGIVDSTRETPAE